MNPVLLVLFLIALVAVSPLVGTAATHALGRKRGALATALVTGGVAWLMAGPFTAMGVGLMALLLVGVLGIGVSPAVRGDPLRRSGFEPSVSRGDADSATPRGPLPPADGMAGSGASGRW